MFPAFIVFRRSLWPMLFRLGHVPSPQITDGELEEAWRERRAWIEHLWRTAAENWVAVADGALRGIAQEPAAQRAVAEREPQACPELHAVTTASVPRSHARTLRSFRA